LLLGLRTAFLLDLRAVCFCVCLRFAMLLSRLRRLWFRCKIRDYT
jgi:hypothetical protein